ncbi:MAG: sigma-70 family RNA polymerase sigma factor [Patescibacteria group bacterium]
MLDGEKNIIERAIGGEASAFGLLYDHYQPQIYRFVYLKVSHREEAEDLTHQVFLSAWQNITKYQYQGHLFSSWLYSIARNKVIDHYRTRKPLTNIEFVAETEIQINSNGELNLDGRIEMEKVKKAIVSLLNDTEQDVIIMKFVEDLSQKEIAEIINKSEGAIKVIQHRALKKLKDSLNQN